jgi:hypothetical protein
VDEGETLPPLEVAAGVSAQPFLGLAFIPPCLGAVSPISALLHGTLLLGNVPEALALA